MVCEPMFGEFGQEWNFSIYLSNISRTMPDSFSRENGF